MSNPTPAPETFSSRVILESGHQRLVKGRYGYVLYNKNDVVIGRMIEAYGEYFESEVELFRQMCRPGDVVIDCGANIGTHTLAFANLVGPNGRVYAFEAQRIIHQTLCANVALNSLDNVETIHAAVGAQNGEMRLGDLRQDVQINYGGAPLDKIPGMVRTPVTALDSHLIDLPRLRMIKVDVEGMELDVLRGATELMKKFRPGLYVENDRPDKSEELIEFLRAHNYRAYWHLPSDFNPENFFANATRIFPQHFIDTGAAYLQSIGFAVNLVCLPSEAPATMNGFREVTDAKEHPMKREYNKSFTAAPPPPLAT